MDTFELDGRRAVPSPSNYRSVAVGPSNSTMSLHRSSASSNYFDSATQTEPVNHCCSIGTQTSSEPSADDGCNNSSIDQPTVKGAQAAVQGSTTTSGTLNTSRQDIALAQDPASSPRPPAVSSQEDAINTQDPAAASQNVTQTTIQAAQASSSFDTATPPHASLINSDGPTTCDILEEVPYCEHYAEHDFSTLIAMEEFCNIALAKAERSADGTSEGASILEWKLRLRKAIISIAVREEANKALDEQQRLSQMYPAGVIRAKNARDSNICCDPQDSTAGSVHEDTMEDAVEGWRDTLDGRADDYNDVVSEGHSQEHMGCEDFDGIDNNKYHDYFPIVSRKTVYHSTAVQTQMLTTPLIYEKVYGQEPTKAEMRQILRGIGSPGYVDHSELRYGTPFLTPQGVSPDMQTETQDSGFQIMDYEFREANILKTQTKAGLTASKLNKISLERNNGIRVFAEPSKDRLVHSQQFNALPAVVDKDGTVESYGNFTPMIHNVVYEAIDDKTFTQIAQARAKSPTSPSPFCLTQPKASVSEAQKPTRIESYCRSPSPSSFEDAQRKQPEMFEMGWPMNKFQLEDTCGGYSSDIIVDFGLPNTYIAAKTTAKHDHTPTPTKQKGKDDSKKRNIGDIADEGYTSNLPPSPSSARSMSIAFLLHLLRNSLHLVRSSPHLFTSLNQFAAYHPRRLL